MKSLAESSPSVGKIKTTKVLSRKIIIVCALTQAQERTRALQTALEFCHSILMALELIFV